MTNDKPENVAKWFATLTEEQAILADILRTQIFHVNPNFNEEIKWKMPNYSLNKLICYLQKSKAHVTIGFQQGAHLNDPNGYLQGSGKDMRHRKIALKDEIDLKKITYLIEQAIQYDQSTTS